MIETQLIINQYDASGIITKSFDVDLNADAPFYISRSIVDLSEPDKRESDHTFTLEIPGTDNNNKIFNSIFELSHSIISTSSLNFTPDFNPNLKANCYVLKNGVMQLKGYLQLNNISVTDANDITYECSIVGRSANLFQDIGDAKLTDLDFSAYNQAWSKANIEASWAATIGVGIVYPLIDRGADFTEVNYKVSDIYPAVYVKTIWDKIFAKYGYTYTSTFLASTRFKRLIIPFGGEKFSLGETSIANRTFLLDLQSDTTTYASGTQEVDWTNPDNVRPSVPDGFSAGGNSWTAPYAAYYNFNFTPEIEINNTSGTSQFFTIITKIIINGVVSQLKSKTGSTPSGTASYTIPTFLYNHQLKVGDIMEVEALVSWSGGGTWKYKAGTEFYSNVTQVEYSEGDTIEITNALPTDISQSDFLTSIIKCFNLYVMPDPIDDKKLIIEPRDDFYNSTVVDLTAKWDVSKATEITPMALLNSKEYVFAYKQDEDEYNTLYQEAYPESYGYYKKIVDNDFVKETYRPDIIFSPTPLQDSSTSDRIISKIRFYDAQNNSYQTKASKIRLLYYGGVTTTTTAWNLISNGVSYPKTDVPYAGHLDNPLTPTFDLSFGIPKAFFYGGFLSSGMTISNGTLYNYYWKKTIDEITNKDSRLVKMYFHLTEQDLLNLDFRKKYLVAQQFYRLHKVEFDLNSNEPTMIEFVSLLGGSTFVVSTNTSFGGEVLVDDDPSGERFYQTKQGDNSYNGSAAQYISGANNIISGDAFSIYVTGNDNVIGSEASGIQIYGSKDNLVYPQIYNAMLINSYDNEIQHNDCTLINSNGITTTAANQLFINSSLTPTYGAFHDSTTQTAAAENVGQVITINTTDEASGVSIVSGSQITVAYPAVYNIQWSGQFMNVNSQIKDVQIWIRKNGTDIASTNGLVSVQNEHGGNNGTAIVSWNYVLTLAAGDYIQFMWMTSSVDVTLQFYGAGSPPPASPSIIITVTKV